MTIRIKKDRIEFDGYTLYETPQGLFLNTNINAACFNDMFQGTVAWFLAGGYASPPPSPGPSCVIERYPFSASSGTATVVGSLSAGRHAAAPHSSATNAFISAGYCGAAFPLAATQKVNTYPYSSNYSMTDAGTLSATAAEGYSGTSSSTNGYITGGIPVMNCMHKFPFSTFFSSSTNVGTLSRSRDSGSGTNSPTHGYDAGGAPVPGSGYLDKFPFATDTSSTNIGNMGHQARSHAGISSPTSGYAAGGGYPQISTVSRWPFATDSGSTIGNLLYARDRLSGASSQTHGYAIGGICTGAGTSANFIERFPFASDTSMSCVGSLTCNRSNSTPAQD